MKVSTAVGSAFVLVSLLYFLGFVSCSRIPERFKILPTMPMKENPRLPLAFIASNVTVSYADTNLKFTNATYYYDYYNRAERIDLFNVNTTYLPEQTIINIYGPSSLRVKVDTYLIKYKTIQVGGGTVISLNCTKTRDFWQFGYGMDDMPNWSLSKDSAYVREEFDGKLKYQLWQGQYNGESNSYRIVTDTRDEFARLLYGMDDMVQLKIDGSQGPFTANPQNFNPQLFGC
ncbi:predicted protein [Naegleria gruberi]|uniref:Predicted protein n=1 Tax=Naegleria gruberi TaxID=5762 RepID=D2VVN0_NAEGR|nr:uncharacterized protein NAEGRDRAFT_73076 [Naegleria gruberi]EFC39134.1 predicted protein [Naegleria gruberi]|eukprot:XP_002671878.1 predicted protein [Naegleria gruberi strain NEG-M]